jgi:hypothetical protein
MSSDHLVTVEAVKAYLLGKLDEPACALLEERYFTERACLLRIREIETDLISDYLDQSLSTPDRRMFEHKYLNVPGLFQRVEEVRASRAGRVSRPVKGFMWRPMLVWALLLTLCVGGWYFKYHQAPMGANSVATVIALRLTPGQSKGFAEPPTVVLPRGDAKVKLVLELRDVHTPIRCSVRLLLPGEGGAASGKTIELGQFSSAQEGGGQIVTIEVPSQYLVAADYLVEVTDGSGNRIQTYSLRVNR